MQNHQTVMSKWDKGRITSFRLLYSTWQFPVTNIAVTPNIRDFLMFMFHILTNTCSEKINRMLFFYLWNKRSNRWKCLNQWKTHGHNITWKSYWKFPITNDFPLDRSWSFHRARIKHKFNKMKIHAGETRKGHRSVKKQRLPNRH